MSEISWSPRMLRWISWGCYAVAVVNGLIALGFVVVALVTTTPFERHGAWTATLASLSLWYVGDLHASLRRARLANEAALRVFEGLNRGGRL